MAALQTDENGQKFAVFRVTVGTPTDMQTISLKKGWNLVALSVAPVNANVSDVFSDGGVRFYNGSVWQYQDGKYVEATTLEAAWKIPWPEELGWLLSMGLQRVGHPFEIRGRAGGAL